MKWLALSAALIIAALPAEAALSGFYDSAAKIAAILDSPAVADAVRQAPVGMISEIGATPEGHGLWQVRVQDCDLEVVVIAHPPKGPGMTTYSVEVPGICE